MTLATTLTESVCAAFNGLYVHTFEPDEALREIAELCRQQEWRLATWDLDQDLSARSLSLSLDYLLTS